MIVINHFWEACGCFLCFSKSCISSCMELEGISTDCAALLLLLYFRLTSFHLESMSVALLFSQGCDFGQLWVGDAPLLELEKIPLLISSWSPSHPPHLFMQQQPQLMSSSFIDMSSVAYLRFEPKKIMSPIKPVSCLASI